MDVGRGRESAVSYGTDRLVSLNYAQFALGSLLQVHSPSHFPISSMIENLRHVCTLHTIASWVDTRMDVETAHNRYRPCYEYHPSSSAFRRMVLSSRSSTNSSHCLKHRTLWRRAGGRCRSYSNPATAPSAVHCSLLRVSHIESTGTRL